MVERSLSMREVMGSIPISSNFSAFLSGIVNCRQPQILFQLIGRFFFPYFHCKRRFFWCSAQAGPIRQHKILPTHTFTELFASALEELLSRRDLN